MKKEYMVSVVTPLHNTDMECFKKCFASVEKQTIGFENIEWVIVVHNSTSEICDQVLKMAEPYPNVIVDILRNEIYSPSSPRNRGMMLASAPYLGFLDADDSYTPNCMEDVLSQIRGTGAQIVSFRRSYEVESRDSAPITELTMFNQTYRSIVLEHKTWTHEDQVKMFTGLCGMVTSRLYDFRFLKENHLLFDEEVPFAEDYLFNLNAYAKADRVCYLPQTIGYHYYINRKSLVQSSAKNGRVLLSYTRGFKKLFDTGINNGFYMDSIIARLCRLLSKFIVCSEDITTEERRQIKEILEPYILRTPMLHVEKIYTEREIHELYEFPREVILDEENWGKIHIGNLLLNTFNGHDAAFSVQQRVLLDILKLNGETDLGHRYHLYSINTVMEFQKKVDLSSQEDYRNYIELTTKIGESGIFTKDRVIGYCFEMGMQNNTVLYPFTQRHLSLYEEPLSRVLREECTWLMFDSGYAARDYNDDTSSYSLFKLLLDEYYANRKRDSLMEADVGASPDIALLEEYQKSDYLKLLFALKNENITQIVTANASYFHMRMMQLKKIGLSCIRDIESGEIRDIKKMSPMAQKLLKLHFSADPQRAAALRESFRLERMEDALLRIWPNLKQIVFLQGDKYSSYLDRLKASMKKIKIKNGPILEAVGPFGIPMGAGNEFRLNLRAAFYEFIPADGNSERPLLAFELEKGKKYRMVVTNYAGLLRYVTDEVIVFKRYDNDKNVIFTFSRDDYTVKWNDIELSLDTIERVMSRLQKKLSVKFNYSAASVLYDKLTFFIELEDSGSPDGISVPEIQKLASQLLKAELYGSESLSEEERKIACDIVMLAPETTIYYDELTAARQGLSEEITCPPGIIKTEADYNFLKACAEVCYE